MIPRRLLDTTVGLTEISMIWLTRWMILTKTHQRTSVVVVTVIIAVSHKVVGSVISVAITHP